MSASPLLNAETTPSAAAVVPLSIASEQLPLRPGNSLAPRFLLGPSYEASVLRDASSCSKVKWSSAGRTAVQQPEQARAALFVTVQRLLFGPGPP